MKERTNNRQPDQSGGALLKERRGVALIIVIAFVVLLSGLIIGFFSRVTTELAGAGSYAEGISARQLADTAVSVIEGQVRSATTVPNAAWASQPGMIRTFANGPAGTTVAGSNAFAFYKLYSSHDMVVSGNAEFANFDPTSNAPAGGGKTEVPLGAGGWLEQPAHFTDVNEPISIPNPDLAAVALGGPPTVLRYPIFDPSVARIPALAQNMTATSPTWVEGAEVNLPAGPDLTRNNAPMPVRWIYVLKDGTLTANPLASAPTAADPGTVMKWNATGPDGASITGVPTWDNPIVGRIAFWGDDETSKVNINTAAGYVMPSFVDENDIAKLNYRKADNYPNAVPLGAVEGSATGNAAFIPGSFWDSPRVQTIFDRGRSGKTSGNLFDEQMQAEILDGSILYPNGYNRTYIGGLATSQVCAHEFQRYPGHVAQTSLSLVYRNLLGSLGIDQLDPSGRSPSETVYVMTPRIQNGGSLNGTNLVDQHAEGPLGLKSSWYTGATTKSDATKILNTTWTGQYLIVTVPSTVGLAPGMTVLDSPPGSVVPFRTTIGSIINPTTITLSAAPVGPIGSSGTSALTYVNWSYHLYSSVDELVFASRNQDIISTADATRPWLVPDPPSATSPGLRRVLADTVMLPTGVTTPTITPPIVDKTRFFVTAHNRAPELNLFGQPRVCIWPVPTWNAMRNWYILAPAITLDASVPLAPLPGVPSLANANEDLIRFCSTIGAPLGSPNSNDPDATFYYKGGTYTDPVLGTGTSDPSHLNRPGQFIFDREDPYSPVADFQRKRNQVIMNYLASANITALTNKGVMFQNVPGWGTSFSAKYPSNAAGDPAGIEGIMTEIFDYIRCANLKDTTRDKAVLKMTAAQWPPSGGSIDGTGNMFKTDPVSKMAAPPNPSNSTGQANTKRARLRYAPRGIVIPTRSTMNGHFVAGFGRYTTVTACDLVFYHGGYLFRPNPVLRNSSVTAGSNTVTIAAADGGTANLLVGMVVTGAGLPPPSVPPAAPSPTVASVPNATTLVLSQPATTTGTGILKYQFPEDVTYDLMKVDNKYTGTGRFLAAGSASYPGNAFANSIFGTAWRNNNAITGQLVRSFLIFELYNPMQGYAPTSNLNMANPTPFERMVLDITNMSAGTDWSIKTPLRVPDWTPLGQAVETGTPSMTWYTAMLGATKLSFSQASGSAWGGRNFGGIEGYRHLLSGKCAIDKDTSVGINVTTNPEKQLYYPFQSPCMGKKDGVIIPWDVVHLTGCTVTSGSNIVTYNVLTNPPVAGGSGNSLNPNAAANSTAPQVGMLVVGNGIPVGTTIAGVGAGSITLSVPATSSPGAPVDVNAYTTDTTFSFSGGTLDLKVSYFDATHTGPLQDLQTIHLQFPPSTVAASKTTGWPLPITERETGNALVTAPWPTTLTGTGWWQDSGGFDGRVSGLWNNPNPGVWSGPSAGVNHSFNAWVVPPVTPAGSSPINVANAVSYGSPKYFVRQAWTKPQALTRYNGSSQYWTVGTNQNISSTGWAMAYHLGARVSWSSNYSWGSWGAIDTWWRTKPPWNAAPYGPPTYPAFGRPTGGDNRNYSGRWRQLLQPGDTIRSLVVGGTGAVPMGSTDPRAVAIQTNVAVGTLGPHPLYNTQFCKDGTTLRRRAEVLRHGAGWFNFSPTSTALEPGGLGALEPSTGSLVPLGPGVHHRGETGPYVPRNYDPANPTLTTANTVLYQNGGPPNYADFDTGLGSLPDGGFNNKPDEGNLARFWYDPPGWDPINDVPTPPTVHWVEPYFNTWVYDPPLDTYFSPNRQMPSPVTFGSLLAPQGPWATAGWKTLLFCPNPANVNHPGLTGIPDHLILDLFWMPVVEPYAISEPLSTEGKVNLNYAIMPFNYLKRTTALRAVLQSVRVTAIPHNWTNARKELSYKGQDNPENVRYLVDRDETLKQFDAMFAQYSPATPEKGFFKSASQICEQFLYPRGNVFNQADVASGGPGPTNANPLNAAPYGTPGLTTSTITDAAGSSANIKAWWATNLLTGDNVREKPYGDIYSRVTTKSNTFTVHWRVQTLRQRPYPGQNADAAAATWYRTWDEGRDQVLSELRGSTTVERYIDPLDSRFNSRNPDGSTNQFFIDVQKNSLEPAYRFRIISNKRFQPW